MPAPVNFPITRLLRRLGITSNQQPQLLHELIVPTYDVGRAGLVAFPEPKRIVYGATRAGLAAERAAIRYQVFDPGGVVVERVNLRVSGGTSNAVFFAVEPRRNDITVFNNSSASGGKVLQDSSGSPNVFATGTTTSVLQPTGILTNMTHPFFSDMVIGPGMNLYFTSAETGAGVTLFCSIRVRSREGDGLPNVE